MIWLLLISAVAATLAATVRIQRYSRGHLVARAILAGRGVYLSCTPDGAWLKVRLRARRYANTAISPGDDPPGPSGVREPRRPRPRDGGDAIALDEPNGW